MAVRRSQVRRRTTDTRDTRPVVKELHSGMNPLLIIGVIVALVGLLVYRRKRATPAADAGATLAPADRADAVARRPRAPRPPRGPHQRGPPAPRSRLAAAALELDPRRDDRRARLAAAG